MIIDPASHRRLTSIFGIGLAVLLVSGCATAPVTYLTRPDTPAKMAGHDHIALVPLDIEIQQISAGGVAEKHDEWTTQVGKNLSEAIAAQTGCKVITAGDVPDGPVRDDWDDAYAMLRVLTINQVMPIGVINRTPTEQRKLTFQLGPIDHIAKAANSDAVLFVVVRDQYSTGGRKAVMALMMIAGAAAGVGVVPQMGVSTASAALVERDGTVLWFNLYATPATDLRNPESAGPWVQALLAGLPAPGHPSPVAPAAP